MKISHEEHQRAIELAASAAHCNAHGMLALAQKFEAEALALMAGGGQSFEQWIEPRGHNLETFNGTYVSKMTQELHYCWQAALGAK
jgi:hypothetical protein